MQTSIEPELLAAQFENASFPFWLVDSDLSLMAVNRTAQELYPAHCLADGVRLFLSPHSAHSVVAAIAGGASIATRSIIGLSRNLALSFTPWVSPTGAAGATVMVTPCTVKPQESDDLRHSLEGVGTLVIAQGLRRCVSDMLASLAVANNQLRSAGVDLVHDQLHDINHDCYRLMRAADNIAGITQFSTVTLNPTATVNFWDSCAELLEAVGTLVRSSDRSFTYSLPDSNLFVECDWDRVASAVLNLVCNSYIYGGSGTQVTITGRDMGSRVHLTVADNGVGLPDAVQQRLYQPFCSWGCLDVGNAGMGLGLYLVRSIITEAGGSVTVNTSCEGTTVAMSLPTCEPPSEPPTLGSSSASYMQDRYSSIYIALCDVVAPPTL